MSNLAAEFAAWMRKRAASSQGETTPDFEVPSDKSPKRSGSDGEAQNSLTVITVDSPEQALDTLLTLEGVTQEASSEPCSSLEGGVPDRGSSDANREVGEAPLEMVAELPFSARLVNAAPHRLKGPSRLVLNSPIIPMKWEQPSLAVHVLDLDTAQLIVDHWSPLNKRDTCKIRVN